MQIPTKPFLKGIFRYVCGDATQPLHAGHRLILQVNNDLGAYGAGFSGALSKRWPSVEREYRLWYHSNNNFKLGEIQVVAVQSDISVVNMIAQKGLRSEENPIPLQYDALQKCLNKVAAEALNSKSSVHMPRIGAGLAGGSWQVIEPMIEEFLVNKNINVTVYDLKVDP